LKEIDYKGWLAWISTQRARVRGASYERCGALRRQQARADLIDKRAASSLVLAGRTPSSPLSRDAALNNLVRHRTSAIVLQQ